MTGSAPKVFISYRREETAGHAGRLYDVMSNRFGDSNVFMDVDIAPGVDFVERIKEAVGRSHVLLVIMGPRWAAATAGGSLPRIFEPEDFVRLEVETGIQRPRITVIPVLVGGATMPDPTALPAPLRALTRRNAIELSDTRWRYDVDRLLNALNGLLKDTSAVQKAVPRPPAAPATPVVARAPQQPLATPRPVVPPAPVAPAATPRRDPPNFGGAMLALSTTVVAAVVGVAARGAANSLRWNPDTETRDHFRQVAELHALTWGLMGAAVALWLTVWLRRRNTGVGPLLLGAVTGALAGVAAGGGYWAGRDLVVDHPATDKLELYGVIGVAIAGALMGSLIGWVWRRRGSAGLVAGLLAGALAGLLLRDKHGGSDNDRVTHVLLEAILIVGVVTLTQALLDAWEERSARAAEPSRRALT